MLTEWVALQPFMQTSAQVKQGLLYVVLGLSSHTVNVKVSPLKMAIICFMLTDCCSAMLTGSSYISGLLSLEVLLLESWLWLSTLCLRDQRFITSSFLKPLLCKMCKIPTYDSK